MKLKAIDMHSRVASILPAPHYKEYSEGEIKTFHATCPNCFNVVSTEAVFSSVGDGFGKWTKLTSHSCK